MYRHGDLEGVFVSTPDEVAKAIGSHVYFGEVMGKHSEVRGIIKEGEIKEISDDQSVVKVFEKHLGGCVGYNPLEYLCCEHWVDPNEQECEICESSN